MIKKSNKIRIIPTLRGIMNNVEYIRKSDLSISEIREYYPSISMNGDPWLLALYENIYNQQLLTEFTTQTINDKKTQTELIKRFKDKFNKSLLEINNVDGFWIKFNENQYQYIKEINKFMDSYGWYPSFIVNEQMPYNDNFKKIMILDDYMLINYLPKFDSEVDIRKYEYIYHITPDISIKKIEEIGLTPKNKSKLSNNPERIYFMLPTSDIMFKHTIKSLHDTSKNKKRIDNWYILMIDVKKLPNAIKFYNDPVFEIGNGAVWTYQNIPPTVIKKIKRIPSPL